MARAWSTSACWTVSRADTDSAWLSSCFRASASRVSSNCASSRDCLAVNAETSACFASWSFTSACIDAFANSPSIPVVIACCWRNSFCSCTRRLTSAASAALSLSVASCSSSSRAGLLNSRMTCAARRWSPGAGGSVPRARSSRPGSSGCPRAPACPRLSLPQHRSAPHGVDPEGRARHPGGRRLQAGHAGGDEPTAASARPAWTARRRRFCCATCGVAMSMLAAVRKAATAPMGRQYISYCHAIGTVLACARCERHEAGVEPAALGLQEAELDGEFDDEARSHIALATDDYVRQGMPLPEHSGWRGSRSAPSKRRRTRIAIHEGCRGLRDSSTTCG